MAQHFNTHTLCLDLAFWIEFIITHGRSVRLNRGDYLLKIGDKATTLGYVKSGYLIYETITSSQKASIGGFAFMNALVGDYPRCLYGERSIFSIVAGTECECYIMDATILPPLFDSDLEMAKQGRLFMEAAYRSINQRYYDLYTKSPKERYQQLLRLHPQIIQDVSLQEIASYLCVSPTHLSRIRREILTD